MKDNIKRSGSSSRGSDRISGRDNTTSRPSSGPRQPSGSTNGSDGISAQQNAQLSNIKKDLDEIKDLIQRLLKTSLQQHLGALSLSPYHQESQEQPPPHQYSLQLTYSNELGEPQYLLQSRQAQNPLRLLHPSVPRAYTSDMDHTTSFGQVRGRG